MGRPSGWATVSISYYLGAAIGHRDLFDLGHDAQGASDTVTLTVPVDNRPRSSNIDDHGIPVEQQDDIVCQHSGLSDPDGQSPTISYSWTVDGQPTAQSSSTVSAAIISSGRSGPAPAQSVMVRPPACHGQHHREL